MRKTLHHLSIALCISLAFPLVIPAYHVFADTTQVMDEASDETQDENSQQDSESNVQQLPAVKQSTTSDMSDLEKVIAAQLYMARTCIYAPDWSKNGANTAWGALVYKDPDGCHEAQCSGFARGMKALCDGMDVDCCYVHANAKASNPSHQWVEIKIDKKWYIVDPQCNAASGFLAIFLCSGETYTELTGMTWDKGSYPAVSAKDYSYEKIDAAWNGYKITKVYNKLFK